MYEESSATILSRMLGRISTDVDKSEGNFMSDALTASAEEFASTKVNLDETSLLISAKTIADAGLSDYLDLKCADFAITRKSGTASTGTVTFAGANSTVIPVGTLVQTDAGLQYATNAAVTILNDTIDAAVTAVGVGVAYNIANAVITTLPIAVSGVTAITNASAVTGGTDVESDADLLARLLAKVQLPSTSGNIYDYQTWALSIAGVGGAHIIPLWNGNGTVKVVLIDSTKQPASAAIITAVTNYIETVRPIGATVTVVAATAVPITVTANITKNSAYTAQQVIDNVTASIAAYIKSVAFNTAYISYAQIGNAILDSAGVVDYNTLTVNGATANISITGLQVATAGAVTLNVA